MKILIIAAIALSAVFTSCKGRRSADVTLVETIIADDAFKLITGEKADLQQIVILERFPGEGGGAEGDPKSITTVTERETMHAIYDELQRAQKTAMEMMGEPFYHMVSPHYELSIHFSENTDAVYVFNIAAVRFPWGYPDVSCQASANSIKALLETIIN